MWTQFRDRRLLVWTLATLSQAIFAIGVCYLLLEVQRESGLQAPVFWVIGLVASTATCALMLARYYPRKGQEAHNQPKIAKAENAIEQIAASTNQLAPDTLSLSVSRAISKGGQQARDYIDNMPVGLLTTNESGIVKVANLRALTIFQTTIDRVVGRPITELIHLRQATDHTSFDAFRDSLLGKLAEATAYTSEAKTVPIDAALSDYSGFGGEGYIINFSDLSDRYEVERFKEEFLSMVSHDLRSPLTSIAIFLSTLVDSDTVRLSDKQTLLAEVANEEAKRLIRLVNSLLDLTVIQSGRLKLHYSRINLMDLLAKVIAGCSYACRRKNLSIQIDCTHELALAADADRIYQVLENLIGNAIKFSPRDSAIQVRARLENNVITVSVEDSGPGIPEHSQQRIFQRFQQLNDHDALLHGGKGLGLTICKFIVEQHGGSIGVSNLEEGGSKFWFTLNTEH